MWFRRDLRIADNPALAHALMRGAVLPVYLLDPQDWRQPDRAARQLDFIAECLSGLRDDLATLGLPLAIRSGPVNEVLERLCRAHGIAEIVTAAAGDTCNLRIWAKAQGICWTEVSAPAEADLPAARAIVGVEPGPLPQARALGLRDDPCPHRQRGGRQVGLALLDSFLSTRGAGYRDAQTSPRLSERGSSRLSPYLAQGVLSRAEVAAAVAARLADRPGGDWCTSLHRFRNRLTTPAAPGPVPVAGTADLSCWLAGETGLPFLDACLRQLRTTGWLEARLRELVVTAAIWLLDLPEAAVGAALARRLTDYDPAILWPEVARLGRTGLPRLVNPVAAGMQLDPEGRFTRRWLPELAAVPPEALHMPWRWSGARTLLGRTYPEPLVDPATALRAARLTRPRPSRPPQGRDAGLLIEGPPRRAVTGQLSLDL